ncbi:lysophospholipase catalytic domain-containing protein [Dioszegia hungarica]|uniref:Lysophospholipase n=1 Tax=Dioszegia hungarica TaxID=4972 RepID=A0AA38LSI2_9TREE|nr:lysophospholipase catalytic domain-containing protein [Dioszegia hungarica]KAI9633403.1 lysophospholipase catalytic domain-containing protein [Dioszegia hungarica]
MLVNAILPLVLLNSLAFALPSSPNADAEFRRIAKRALALRLVKDIEEQTRDGGKVDLDTLLSPQERQLLGGGDEYAPYQVPCPTGWNWVRSADSLGVGEQAYLAQRKPYLNPAINKQLARVGLPQPNRTPVIGFALSGGGYRAMQVGSGGVMATMNQSSEAAASGIGGWYEGVTYQAGLSGGSWATTTMMANNGRLPTELINDVWNLESNLVIPDDGKLSFYYNMVSNVRAKANAGFATQITDYWSLALGDHLLPSQYHLGNSPNYTIAQLPSKVPGLANGSLPMPIIIAAERELNEIVIPGNASVYEMTPYEFGSWAFGSQRKVRGAFTPIEYLGSSLNNGQLNGSCYKGFDQLSFAAGTSSTLFSGALLTLTASNASSIIVDAIESILKDIGEQDNDVALFPNSFANWNPDTNPIADFPYITLVDAGLTNQNIPIEPLLIPYRNVDAIIAFDSSADTTYSWPNGTALRQTFERAEILAQTQDVSIRMPKIPSANGFINGGFNQRPTIFGCDAQNGSTPLIVYVPNYPWSYYGNTSTYQLAYEKDESTKVVLNGLRSLSLNGTVSSWPKCLACAMADRAYNTRPADCQSCFDTWCWDGTDNTTTPSSEYEPVVGTLPSFISSRNLGSAGAAVGASNAVAAQSSSPAASASVSASQGAAQAMTSSGMLGWGGAIVGVMVGVISGAVAVAI